MSDGMEQGSLDGDQRRDARTSSGGAQRRTVALIPGEGVGTEVMSAMRRVLDAAGADIEWEVVEAGEGVRSKGVASGLPWETIDAIQRNRLVVRGPLSIAPSGLGPTDRLLHRAFDVASQEFWLRSPAGVWTGLGKRELDFWLVRSTLREQEQEIGAGLPWDSWPTSLPAGPVDEPMLRRAFERARRTGSGSLHCAVQTGQHGLLRVRRIFEAVAADYPGIRAECVDQYLLAQELVSAPERFQVLVTSNAVGDVVTELAGRAVAGLSFVALAELGPEVAMFAPGEAAGVPLAGGAYANPVGAIRAGVLLLRHVRQEETALRVERGLALALEQGLATPAAAGARTPASTAAFADAVIASLESERPGPPPPGRGRPAAGLRRWKALKETARLPR